MQSEIKKIYWPVVAFLIVQTFISSELFWILGLTVCGYYIIIKRKGKIMIPFSEYKTLFVFLIWGALLGIIGVAQGRIVPIDMIRDVFYYSNPIIFMYLGATYAKDKVNIYRILNAFIITCGITSLILLVNVIQNYSALSLAFSINNWRDIAGQGGVILGVSLAIIFSGIIPKEMRLKKGIMKVITALSVVYFLVCLSRTNIIILAIMYTVLVFQKGNINTVLKRVFGAFALVAVAVVLLNAILPKSIAYAFTEKLLSSFNEINSSNSWVTNAEIQGNWRGYETYCAITQWKGYDVLKQIIGAGFGERIYVGRYAYTLLKQVDQNGNSIESIAVLHNGYATQLIKLGVLGAVGYLFFYLQIIRKAWRAHKRDDSLFSRLLLSLGLVLLAQTYFLNGLFKDYCFFPIIIMIGYSAYNIQYRKNLKSY